MTPTDDAIAIWKASVAAVDPYKLTRASLLHVKHGADRVIVVGGGKAGRAMAAAVWDAIRHPRRSVVGIVNVPEGGPSAFGGITCHSSRALGSNYPTPEGVAGVQSMLGLLRSAGPNDVAIGLLSGGGSALLPAPVSGISLADKIITTRLLSDAGATITELNAVRKHLSACKGGRMAAEFRGRQMINLIISDVVGNPLDVIASGPTVADPTTFSDAMSVLKKHNLIDRVPAVILDHLQDGVCGVQPETPKRTPANVQNLIVGSNKTALIAAASAVPSRSVGDVDDDYVDNDGVTYRAVKGESRVAAQEMAQAIRNQARPKAILFGGETTVTLGPNPGKGGRNQEFVLAMLCELGLDGMKGVTILSGGTDGEDGPTDAAGAIGTEETLKRAQSLGLNPRDYLDRHDAYHFFEATGGLFKTGLTGTNVMDLGVILLQPV